MVDVCGPAETFEEGRQTVVAWDSATRGHFVYDWDDYSEEGDHPDGDDEEYGIYVEEDPASKMKGHSKSDMGD